LPGVEVNTDGNRIEKEEKVTQMLVDGKKFFEVIQAGVQKHSC
jgi:hypothetical protein